MKPLTAHRRGAFPAGRAVAFRGYPSHPRL